MKRKTYLILGFVLLVAFLFVFSYYDSLNQLSEEPIIKVTPQQPAIRITVVDKNVSPAVRIVVVDNPKD